MVLLPHRRHHGQPLHRQPPRLLGQEPEPAVRPDRSTKILTSFVYVGCAKVTATSQTRSIQRTEMLIQLLSNNSQFCECLLKHIAKLQLDRERCLSSEEVARSWLFKEAAKVASVVKYRTLKSSCVSFIELRPNLLV